MSKNSRTLVLQQKANNSSIGIAKIQIKPEKQTPFGGFLSIMEKSERSMNPVIDKCLSLRGSSSGYQYSEIRRSLMTFYLKTSCATAHIWEIVIETSETC